MGSIGDVVRALPIAHAIKAAYPKCFLAWMIEPKCFDLISSNKFIDKIFLFKRSNGMTAFLKVIKETRDEKFDLTLDLQRHLKSGLASFFSGSNKRLGFHRKNSKELNFIFNTDHIKFIPDTVSKLNHYLEFLSHLEIEVPNEFNFSLVPDPEENLEIKSRVSEVSSPLVGLVLGSTWKSKDWFPLGYLNLARIIVSKSKGTVVLIGDKSKMEIGKKIEEQLPPDRILNFTGVTTLKELIYLLSRLTVCVGPDSGPGHISAALKIPYITLFGPTAPERVVPYKMESLVLKSVVGCSPCSRRICPGLNTVCMRLISPETVAERVFSTIS